MNVYRAVVSDSCPEFDKHVDKLESIKSLVPQYTLMMTCPICSKKVLLFFSDYMINILALSYDMRHEKTDLKVFLVVITKRRMGTRGRAHPSFGMTLTF